MMKVLVVDDEELVRDDIAFLLKKYDKDIEIVGEACNGREALELAQKFTPDLVIVDIRMPIMNGLELMKVISKHHASTRFIVLSGYADFNYAQEALKAGANDYLLKPIQDEQFFNSVSVVIKQVRDEKLISDKIEKMDRLIEENMQLSLDHILNKLIASGPLELKEMKKFFEKYGYLRDRYYSLAVFRLNSQGSESTEEIRFNVKNVIEKTYLGCHDSYVFENISNHLELILMSSGETYQASGELIKMRVDESQNIFREYLKVLVTVGISNTTANIDELCRLYENSKTALKDRFVFGAGKVFFYKDEDGKPLDEPAFTNIISLLSSIFNNHDAEKIPVRVKPVIEKLFSEENIKQLSLKKIKLLFSEIINVFVLYIKKNKVNAVHLIDSDIVSGDIIDKLDSRFEITGFLNTLVERVVNVNRIYNVDVKSLINEIKAYMEQNYYEQITLGGMADKFGINPNYLSGVFKVEVKVNFVDYLTAVRLEKSKELLQSTSLSISEITLNVGYNYQAYFQRVFKKTEGITPLEYRLRYKR